MKKCICFSYFIFSFILIIIMSCVNNTKYEDVISSLREVAYSYYIRGTNIQYNLAKDHFFSPEEATSQNINYLVVTSFTTTVFQELLNITIPYSPSTLLIYGLNNIGNPEVFAYGNQSGDNLDWKIYDPKEEKNYTTKINLTFEEMISLIKLGDVLVYPGYAFIIYDLIKDEKGIVVDAILMESSCIRWRDVNTKIQRTSIVLPNIGEFSNIGYNLFWENKFNIELEEGISEGTIKIKKLSANYLWKNIGGTVRTIEYAILRFINNSTDGNAILNYKNVYTYYKNNFSDYNVIELNDKNKDRDRFKHLYIEKTVDKINNNIVELGESLTYKIIIKNMGKTDYTNDLIVREFLSTFVIYKSRKENKKIISFKEDKKNRQLIWNIGKLKKGDEFIINYTVKVSNGKTKDLIESKGLVGNISSSTIYNTIGINLKEKQMNSIKNSYEDLLKKNKKNFNGKNFINEIYKKAFNIDIHFDKFNITELIINNDLISRSANTIFLNETHPFFNTVLNKYWSSLASAKYTFIPGGEEVTVYNLKEYEYFIQEEKTFRREDFIYKETFKTGDILIYTNYFDFSYSVVDEKLVKKNNTNENGEYAYIYIEGNGFVGINFGNDGTPNTEDDRNEFNYKYYTNNNLSLYQSFEYPIYEMYEIDNLQTLFVKDNYAILRPSLKFNFPVKDKKSYGLIIFLTIFIVIIVLFALIVLWKYLKLKKQGKEFNFKNLKEQPLLG